MTIVLPKDYHAKAALEKGRILCVTDEDALREDIRALRIGILNIMPKAETYEFSLLYPLGRSVLQIQPIWIRLKTHEYRSSNQAHLDRLYLTFEEASESHLDGLILTGAPVEEIPFEEVSYWDEIKRILKYAHNNIASTLGICWGGLAIAKFLGIEKVLYKKKIFGVYQMTNLDRSHPITGELDDVFWCPQSRHSGIPDDVLELERDRGTVNLLAHADGDAGYTIFESSDQRFLMHLGHPEYEPRRLVEEYMRDQRNGRADVDPPRNIDLKNPLNTWRGHRSEFFAQWIKYIHDTTTY
jgi:homoserine O-succinyltransferase/O-acetyltransferase